MLPVIYKNIQALLNYKRCHTAGGRAASLTETFLTALIEKQLSLCFDVVNQ